MSWCQIPHVFIKTVICWNISVTLQIICSLENVFIICGILLLRCRLYFQRKPVKLKIQIKLPFYLCMEIITCTLTGGNSISNPETFPLSVPGPILSTLQCKLIQVCVSWCGCTAHSTRCFIHCIIVFPWGQLTFMSLKNNYLSRMSSYASTC